jgi:hypothetical protein
MGKQMDWTAIDRSHEDAELAGEAFDEAVTREMPRQAAAIRSNIQSGQAQTLDSVTDDLLERISESGVTQGIVRAALVGGPLAAGQLLLELINKQIENMAELAAIKEVERDERGGLDMAAIRAAAPADMQVFA